MTARGGQIMISTPHAAHPGPSQSECMSLSTRVPLVWGAGMDPGNRPEDFGLPAEPEGAKRRVWFGLDGTGSDQDQDDEL